MAYPRRRLRARAEIYIFIFPDINFWSLFSYVGVAAPCSAVKRQIRRYRIRDIEKNMRCEIPTKPRARSPTAEAFVCAESFLKKHYEEKCVRCEYLRVITTYHIRRSMVYYYFSMRKNIFLSYTSIWYSTPDDNNSRTHARLIQYLRHQ